MTIDELIASLNRISELTSEMKKQYPDADCFSYGGENQADNLMDWINDEYVGLVALFRDHAYYFDAQPEVAESCQIDDEVNKIWRAVKPYVREECCATCAHCQFCSCCRYGRRWHEFGHCSDWAAR